MSARVVVPVAYAVIGLSMARMREVFKRGFFKEMTRWTSLRTIVR